jgi:hypothetical protein
MALFCLQFGGILQAEDFFNGNNLSSTALIDCS